MSKNYNIDKAFFGKKSKKNKKRVYSDGSIFLNRIHDGLTQRYILSEQEKIFLTKVYNEWQCVPVDYDYFLLNDILSQNPYFSNLQVDYNCFFKKNWATHISHCNESIKIFMENGSEMFFHTKNYEVLYMPCLVKMIKEAHDIEKFEWETNELSL